MLTLQSEYGVGAETPTEVEVKKDDLPAEAPKSLTFDDVYKDSVQDLNALEQDANKPAPATPPEENKEEGYTEADYEAAAHAIATLESMKVNLDSIQTQYGSIDPSVKKMAVNTCGVLLKRFSKDDVSLNLESEQGIMGIVDEAITKITSFKQTQTK